MVTKKEDKGLVKRIIGNMFFTGVRGVISKVGGLIFTIIIARTFFPELFGIYSLALTIIVSLSVISDFGLGSTVVRYLSDSIGKKNKKQTRSRFLFLLKSRFFSTALISLLLFLAAGVIASFFKKPELILPLKIGSIYLLIRTCNHLPSSVFLSLQKVKYTTISETIFQVSRIILILVSLYFFKSVAGVFVILSLSLMFSLMYSIRVLFKKYPYILKGKKEPVERRRMLKFAGFLALGSFTLLISSNIDKLILGYYLAAEFIGFYTAIFSVVAGVLGVIGITSIFFPVFTQLKGERLKKTFKKAFHYSSIITFPATIGLAFIILPLLKLLYGVEYVPPQYEFALFITSILLSLIILEAIFSSFYGMLLNSQEKPKIPAMTNFTTSIINIILNIILISYLIKINPSYGLIGASISTFISRYIGMFIIISFSKKKLGIGPELNSIIKPLFASLIMLAYLFVFNYLIPLNILTGILMILSSAILYFIIIFLIGALSFEEIKRIIRRE